MTALYALSATIGVSLLSLIGVFFFVTNTTFIKRSMFFLISFSTGAMLGDVFMHIVPEILERKDNFSTSMLVILAGLLFSFAIEKIIHWRHCHDMDESEEHMHVHPVGILSLIGDAIHNFIDGVIIAASFLASPTIGISTTLAVVFHEIPQEIGDFVVLLHSGFKKKQAVLFNLLSALTAVLGTLTVLFLSFASSSITGFMLPFAAGNLLYIAAADLIPELHKETGLREGFLQVIAMVIGMGCMYALLFLE